MTEKEFKLLINRNDYNRIRKLCPESELKPIIQTNHYFDTESFFFEREDATLRVREKNNEYTFTVKVTEERIVEKGIKVSAEYNFKIDYPSFERLSEAGTSIYEIKPELGKLFPLWKDQFSQIKYLGKLVTERTKFKPSEGIPLIELDRNRYLEYTDFELECEIENGNGIKIFEEWLRLMHLSVTQPMKGKYRRFTSRLKSCKTVFHTAAKQQSSEGQRGELSRYIF